MSMDPSTCITRTDAGVAELSKATHGLSIGQRKILAFLPAPDTVATLLASHQLDEARLERDLAKLQELRLIEVQGPARAAAEASAAVTAPVAVPVIVLGGGRRSSPVLRAVGFAALVGICGGGALWIATSNSGEPAPVLTANPAPSAPASTAAAAPAAQMPPAALAAVLPVAATMLGDAKDGKHKPDALAEVRTPATPSVAPPATPSVAPPATTLDTRIAEPKIPLVERVPLSAASTTELPSVATAVPPIMLATSPIGTSAPTDAVASAPAPSVPSSLRNAPAIVAEPSLAMAPPPRPVQLASAAPSAAATRPPVTALTPVSREQPDFPREAVSAGVYKGLVKARLNVDAAGKVASVSIVEATPRRVFDRAVISALSQWTFNAGAASRSMDVDIVFNRE